MQFRNLRTFVAVASTLNITRASEQLHLAQSSVTEQIQVLEDDLGTKLFDRSRRKFRLTEAGQRLLAYAGDILALTDEARSAVADAAGITAGSLTIGGLETLCASRLPQLLARFRIAHPSLGLQLKAAGSAELRSGLKSGAMDIGFTFGSGFSDPDLQSEVIAQEALVIIAPAGHPLAGREAIEAKDLTGEAFLVTEMGCIYRHLFESAFPATHPERPQIVGEFNSIAAIRSLVETGLGCAIVPRLVADDANDRIAILPWIGDANAVPISMIWRRRRVEAPRLRLFLDAAAACFREARPVDARHRHAAPSP